MNISYNIHTPITGCATDSKVTALISATIRRSSSSPPSHTHNPAMYNSLVVGQESKRFRRSSVVTDRGRVMRVLSARFSTYCALKPSVRAAAKKTV